MGLQKVFFSRCSGKVRVSARAGGQTPITPSRTTIQIQIRIQMASSHGNGNGKWQWQWQTAMAMGSDTPNVLKHGGGSKVSPIIQGIPYYTWYSIFFRIPGGYSLLCSVAPIIQGQFQGPMAQGAQVGHIGPILNIQLLTQVPPPCFNFGGFCMARRSSSSLRAPVWGTNGAQNGDRIWSDFGHKVA